MFRKFIKHDALLSINAITTSKFIGKGSLDVSNYIGQNLWIQPILSDEFENIDFA